MTNSILKVNKLKWKKFHEFIEKYIYIYSNKYSLVKESPATVQINFYNWSIISINTKV